VRVKTPAVDGVAIGGDETRRNQTPAIRHDCSARFQKGDEIAGSLALPPNKSATVGTETDHDVAVVAHVERSETSLVDGANRLHASVGLPDPGLLIKIAVGLGVGLLLALGVNPELYRRQRRGSPPVSNQSLQPTAGRRNG
jgi:hypothetical protein